MPSSKLSVQQQRELNQRALSKVRAVIDMVDIHEFFIHPHNDSDLTEDETNYLLEVIEALLSRPVLPPRYISLKRDDDCLLF